MSISHFVGINSELKQLEYLGEIGDVDYDLNYIAEGASSNLVRSRIVGFTFYYRQNYWVELRYCQDLRTVGDVGGYQIEDKFQSFFLLFGIPI